MRTEADKIAMRAGRPFMIPSCLCMVVGLALLVSGLTFAHKDVGVLDLVAAPFLFVGAGFALIGARRMKVASREVAQ